MEPIFSMETGCLDASFSPDGNSILVGPVSPEGNIIKLIKGSEMKLIETEHPLLILLDIRMKKPGDGITVLKWIREKKFKTRVIMVSAVPDRDVYEEVMKLGADDFISKPFDPEKFTKTITDHMDAIVRELDTNS